MKHLNVNFDRKLGAIKPVNGVNNGPLTCNFAQDARPYFKEAAIPFSRLHDTEYPFGSGEFVDVHCIFKNFSCDENDPANYNFTLTDEYLKAILECGTKVIYRLGTTIEHQPIKVHAVPPKDYLKWARICEHIIRHVNEGWGNGYHMGIEYWEIWNEPELPGKQCWTGTTQEFCQFYIQVAGYLKEKFPHLKIGGPAVSSLLTDFPREFVQTVAEAKAPLDFFSWHTYTEDPKVGAAEAGRADALLKEFGLEHTENIYDEWNYVKDWNQVEESYAVIHSAKGAAYTAAMMCALQHSPCDISTYYDGQVRESSHCFAGLFAAGTVAVHGEPAVARVRKPYYAFKAFNELRKLGYEAESRIEDGNVYACAAEKDGKAAVLLVNYHDTECVSEKIRLDFGDMKGKMGVYRLDKRYDLEKAGETESGKVISVAANTAVLLLSEE